MEGSIPITIQKGELYGDGVDLQLAQPPNVILCENGADPLKSTLSPQVSVCRDGVDLPANMTPKGEFMLRC